MKPLVLVVEDEASLVTLLQYNLQEAGFDVASANDGEEALIAVAERAPDLILLDWMLPQVSGIEVCRQLRRKTRDPRHPDHHAHRQDRGRRSGARPRIRRRRLCRQALFAARTDRPGAGGDAPHSAVFCRRGAELCRRDHGSCRPPGLARRRAGSSRAYRVPPPAALHGASGAGVFTRAAARFGVGDTMCMSSCAPSTSTSGACARRSMPAIGATSSAPCAPPATPSMLPSRLPDEVRPVGARWCPIR